MAQPAIRNPSPKRSAHGRPPGPGRWWAVHFTSPELASRRCRLRLRRGQTAGHLARATGTVHVLCGAGLALRRRYASLPTFGIRSRSTRAPPPHENPNSLLQLRTVDAHYQRRTGSSVHLPLPCMSAQNRECFRRPGKIPTDLSHDQWRVESVRPRRRQRKPDQLQFLPEVRFNGPLFSQGVRRRKHRRARGCLCRSRLHNPKVLCLRGAHALLGRSASGHRT
jgi:hypothetical protein